MISTTLRRLSPAVSLVAVCIALLALVAAAAGAGYAAGTIGAKDLKKNSVTAAKIKKNAVTTKKIKKNAVTTDKVKDGSLTPADLAPQEAQHKAVLGNGGEGDCLWRSAQTEIPGSGAPTYRLDRNNRVVLSGIAVGDDAAGGDGACDAFDAGQIADGIAFTLPAGYIPAKNLYLASGGGLLLIAGPSGFNAMGITLPPGAVFGDGVALLDGVTFDPAGSNVVVAKVQASGTWSGDLIK